MTFILFCVTLDRVSWKTRIWGWFRQRYVSYVLESRDNNRTVEHLIWRNKGHSVNTDFYLLETVTMVILFMCLVCCTSYWTVDRFLESIIRLVIKISENYKLWFWKEVVTIAGILQKASLLLKLTRTVQRWAAGCNSKPEITARPNTNSECSKMHVTKFCRDEKLIVPVQVETEGSD